jgi:hypothetical protein
MFALRCSYKQRVKISVRQFFSGKTHEGWKRGFSGNASQRRVISARSAEFVVIGYSPRRIRPLADWLMGDGAAR